MEVPKLPKRGTKTAATVRPHLVGTADEDSVYTRDLFMREEAERKANANQASVDLQPRVNSQLFSLRCLLGNPSFFSDVLDLEKVMDQFDLKMQAVENFHQVIN